MFQILEGRGVLRCLMKIWDAEIALHDPPRDHAKTASFSWNIGTLEQNRVFTL